MEYECKTITVDRSILNPDGFLEPLCNSCSSPDCTNPIKEKTVSIAGQIKKSRFYIVSDSMIRQVISCKGYIGNVIAPVGDN